MRSSGIPSARVLCVDVNVKATRSAAPRRDVSRLRGGTISSRAGFELARSMDYGGRELGMREVPACAFSAPCGGECGRVQRADGADDSRERGRRQPGVAPREGVAERHVDNEEKARLRDARE